MLAILERFIRARAAADIGYTQIQNVKLAIGTTPDKAIKDKCNELIQGAEELKELIDKRLIQLRPDLETYLTIDFYAKSNINMDAI